MTSNYLIYAAVVALGLGYGGKKMIDLSKASENEKKFAPLIADTEKKYEIPGGMLHRLLKQESHFRTDIITGKLKSGVGAMGIAQFMPATAREVLGSEAAALIPERAIDGAGRYLKKLYAMVGNDWKKAVASYNWGVGNVTRKGLANAPLETRNYIKAVMG